MTRKLVSRTESWRLKKPFKISRQTFTHAEVVYCEIHDGPHAGRGEAAGISYKGETVATILADLENVRADVEGGIDRDGLQGLMKPGGARNALDCALWDLEAKKSGKSVWQLVGISPRPIVTVYTLGIGDSGEMAADAAAHADMPVLKVKVGIGDPIDQLAAVRDAAPNADIIIDANQAWSFETLAETAPRLRELGVRMIEQPLPQSDDEALRGYQPPVPLCADESCQTTADLGRLDGLYQFVNIKLDKTGGLTEALNLMDRARAMGFELMVGNMLGSSLAMAPGFVIAQRCTYVDLDGPLLQADDRANAMRFDGGRVSVPDPALWG